MLSPATATFRRRSVSRRSCCALVLFSLVLSTVSIQYPWSAAPSAGCRCNESDRNAGQCCCAKRRAAQGTDTSQVAGSCCSQPSAPRSCCATSTRTLAPSCCAHGSPFHGEGVISISGCTCGGGTSPAGVLDTDPRIVPMAVRVSPDGSVTSLLADLEPALPTCTQPPPVPPPRYSSV